MGTDTPPQAGPEAGDYPEQTQRIVSLLVAKGVITRDEISAAMAQQAATGPENGARLVARAWTDGAFRELLLSDAKAACAQLGIDASGIARFDVLENTPSRHHIVVCTLCSCYPRTVLGLPPAWYKSDEYRARVVREPRTVLAEFGTRLPSDVEVIVVDSTADRRFMVLPVRPDGTEGRDRDELEALVTRDSLIGVGLPRTSAAT